MNENTFVAVGRIERIMTGVRGLTLVIGGTGPVKALVAVQLRDPALIKVVTHPASGFAAGDIVSVAGGLEYDPETHQNMAVAAPGRVSRIARGSSASLAAAPAGAGGNLFGHCGRLGHRADPDATARVPPPDLGFPTGLSGELVGLGDVPL
jgi:hypothetical protein